MLVLSIISCVVWGSSLSLPELSSDLGFPSDNKMMTMSLLEGVCEDSMNSRFPALSQACGKHSRVFFPPLSLAVHLFFKKRKMQMNWGKEGERRSMSMMLWLKNRVWKTEQRNPLCNVPEPSHFLMPFVRTCQDNILFSTSTHQQCFL